jgi:hypothetical protein
MLQYHSNDRKISGEILPVLEEGMRESKDAIATKIHFFCWCFLQCRCRRLFRQLSTEFYQQSTKDYVVLSLGLREESKPQRLQRLVFGFVMVATE